MLNRYITIIVLITSATLGGTKAYLDYRLHAELNKTIYTTKIPATYAETYFTPLGAIRINNLHINHPLSLQIGILTLHQAYQFYDLHRLPASMRLTAQNIQIPINDTASNPPPLLNIFGYAPYYLSNRELRAAGYPTFHAELEMTATKTAENQLMLTGFLNIMQGGKLTWQVELENVPSPAKWTNITLTELTFRKITLSYTEDKLLSQLLAFLARRNKTSVEILKQTLKVKITTDLKQSGLNLDESILISLQRFIQNPETLTLRLQPFMPLTVRKLEELLPTLTLKQLGLTVM